MLGRTYDDLCRSNLRLRSPQTQRQRTYYQSIRPTIQLRNDLAPLLLADRAGRAVQLHVPFVPAHRVRAAASQRAVDNCTPDRYGLGERVGDALACARRVDEDETARGSREREEVEVWAAEVEAPVSEVPVG